MRDKLLFCYFACYDDGWKYGILFAIYEENINWNRKLLHKSFDNRQFVVWVAAERKEKRIFINNVRFSFSWL